MKKNILLFITPKRLVTSIPKYIKESFDNLITNYDAQIIIYYKKEDRILLDSDKKEIFIKEGYTFQQYENNEELLSFSSGINLENNNVEVYTYREAYINIMEKVKQSLGQEVTGIENIFIEKKLQRKNLLELDKSITVNFLKFDNLGDISIEKILKEFNFPFIIKPSSGISSAGVMKIHSKEDLKNAVKTLKDTFEEIIKISQIENYEVIIEEFIEGNMYTIDYFVDQGGKIHKSKLVRTYTLKEEYNIEDFGITKEVLGTEINKEISEKKLNTYLEKCVEGCKVRNTFIHHEFKLTNSGELKTIELNGRIGGYRSEMYKKAYNLDLIELLFNKDLKVDFHNNYTFIGLFPREEINKTLLGLNEGFVSSFKELDSFSGFMIKQDCIGKNIGFTKNGYKYFGSIRLINKNFEQMEKDYNFIKENLDKNIMYKKEV